VQRSFFFLGVLDNMKVSASLIKTWMKCSLQAKYRYVDGLPEKKNAAASFGSAVHLALELYNNEFDVDSAVGTFLYVWDHPDEFDLAPEVWPMRTSFGMYRERGEQFIRAYHEENQWVEKDIVATEHRFCVPIGDHLISGIVDLLEIPSKIPELHIVDYKSGSRPNKTDLGLDVQFTSYLWASKQKEFWCGYEPEKEKYPGFENGEELFERVKNYNVIGIWYDLRNNKPYRVGVREDADFRRLHHCIDQIARAMEAEVFVPTISGDSCVICSFQEQCSAYPADVFVSAP